MRGSLKQTSCERSTKNPKPDDRPQIRVGFSELIWGLKDSHPIHSQNVFMGEQGTLRPTVGFYTA